MLGQPGQVNFQYLLSNWKSGRIIPLYVVFILLLSLLDWFRSSVCPVPGNPTTALGTIFKNPSS